MESDRPPIQYCRDYLDDALARIFRDAGISLELADGTRLSTFRDAILYVLRARNGERAAVRDAVAPRLIPGTVAEELGNENIWRDCFKDALIGS